MKRLRRFLLVGVGIFAAALIALLVFGNSVLNSVVKRKAQAAATKSHPGATLSLGTLRYSLFGNRLLLDSFEFTSTNLTFKSGRIVLDDVNWLRLAFQDPQLEDLFGGAGLDVRGIRLQFPASQYTLSCDHLRFSGDGGRLAAEGILLVPTVGMEEFFAARPFRTTHIKLSVKKVSVSQIAVADALQLKAILAGEARVTGLSFEALVNREKPKKPVENPPPMVHEALAAIPVPLRVDRLELEDTEVSYRERMVRGEEPGELVFTKINLVAQNISNFGDPPPTIRVQGQGNLMDAGTMKVELAVPTRPSSFSLSYSGSLSAMDLASLNRFLEVPEKLRITAGNAKSASFTIQIVDGEAKGTVRANYEDLQIAVLNENTGDEAGFKARLKSGLLNALKVRNDSSSDAGRDTREGIVEYKRDQDDTFIQVLWFALRTGVLDAISH